MRSLSALRADASLHSRSVFVTILPNVTWRSPASDLGGPHRVFHRSARCRTCSSPSFKGIPHRTSADPRSRRRADR